MIFLNQVNHLHKVVVSLTRKFLVFVARGLMYRMSGLMYKSLICITYKSLIMSYPGCSFSYL